jgi:hypothetical protein
MYAPIRIAWECPFKAFMSETGKGYFRGFNNKRRGFELGGGTS